MRPGDTVLIEATVLEVLGDKIRTCTLHDRSAVLEHHEKVLPGDLVRDEKDDTQWRVIAVDNVAGLAWIRQDKQTGWISDDYRTRPQRALYRVEG